MRLVLMRDAERFAALAEDFVAERIERNVLATVLGYARRGRFEAHRTLFGCGLDDERGMRFVALRTSPWPLLASELDGAAADLLMERWIGADPAIPGVSAEPATARAVAAAWTRETGGSSRCPDARGDARASEVEGPRRPARGRLRVAGEDERELLVAWERSFVLEAGMGVVEEAERSVAARLAIGAQLVWEDGGPVCTLTLSPAIAGTVRIGPVYTPPEHRGRGYASSAVAGASRGALAGGARRCMLLTDLANPTSNKIYAAMDSVASRTGRNIRSCPIGCLLERAVRCRWPCGHPVSHPTRQPAGPRSRRGVRACPGPPDIWRASRASSLAASSASAPTRRRSRTSRRRRWRCRRDSSSNGSAPPAIA